jgi:hypothetical protein
MLDLMLAPMTRLLGFVNDVFFLLLHFAFLLLVFSFVEFVFKLLVFSEVFFSAPPL